MNQPYHHGNLRAAIIAAARKQLLAAPDAPLSLRALARSLGVSPNAPYRHFPGKDGVTEALVAEGYRELTRIAEEALSAPRPTGVLVAGYGKLVAAEPALLDLVTRESFAGRDPESEVVLARDEWFAALVALVEAETGRLVAEEAYRRAAGVWAVLLGVTALRARGARGLLQQELLPDAAQLVRSIVRGR